MRGHALLIAFTAAPRPDPAIFTIEATKTNFSVAGFSRLHENSPPAFQTFDVIRVNRRFPARSTHLFRRETGVRMPLLVEKFYGSIRQKAPSERRKLIDESAKLSFRSPQGIESIFERWTALALTDIHNRVFVLQPPETSRRRAFCSESDCPDGLLLARVTVKSGSYQRGAARKHKALYRRASSSPPSHNRRLILTNRLGGGQL